MTSPGAGTSAGKSADPTGVRPRVVLIGAMGAGKSTVARLLCRAWDVDMRDTDADIVTAEGRQISEIFVDDGEAYFRALEREAVATALATHAGVLALGGGAVLDPVTRERLHGHTVVFLRVGLSDAASRVGMGASRPMLLGNVRGQLKAHLDLRTPIYDSLATETVDTADRTPTEVANAVQGVVEARE